MYCISFRADAELTSNRKENQFDQHVQCISFAADNQKLQTSKLVDSTSPSLGFMDLPNFSETLDWFAAGWLFQMVHLLQSRIRVSGHVP